MRIDVADLTSTDAYGILTDAVVPRPVAHENGAVSRNLERVQQRQKSQWMWLHVRELRGGEPYVEVGQQTSLGQPLLVQVAGPMSVR